MKLDVFCVSGFTDGPPDLEKLGPKRKNRKEKAFQQVYRRLKQVGNICQDGQWLSLSHLMEPTQSRTLYPPKAFGAFLSDLDQNETGDLIPFSNIALLRDRDPEAYFTRYDARLENLHCAVMFTLVPTARLVVFKIGGKSHISQLLKEFRRVEIAREMISSARKLKLSR